MHRSSAITGGCNIIHRVEPSQQGVISVDWDGVQHPSEWLKSQAVSELQETFKRNGIMVIESLCYSEELKIYQGLYDKLLGGEVDASAHRHDLGNHADRKTTSENICQIMWPSVYAKNLSQGPLHQRALALAQLVLGDDMAFDFDMLISKGPKTNTETPWHQDASYWLDMPDSRAISFWVAMDETTVDNGCMWFVPGSHLEPDLRPHRLVRPDVHVRMCDCSEEEGKPFPLKPGGATAHHGRMLHYSRGNSTDTMRRGFIMNFRPAAMVQYEREHGYDHGKKGSTGLVAGFEEKSS